MAAVPKLSVRKASRQQMLRRSSALLAIACLWLATVLSGSAWATRWGDTTNYYTWSGFGVLCAYQDSGYLQPGIYGDTWTAWTSDWENGGGNCGFLYGGDHYQFAQIIVTYFSGGFQFTCGDYTPGNVYDHQATSAVIGSTSTGCNGTNQKLVESISGVNWAGAQHNYDRAYYAGG